MVNFVRQFGHLPVLPAAFAGTRRIALQVGHIEFMILLCGTVVRKNQCSNLRIGFPIVKRFFSKNGRKKM
jgi:hypothetical protein